MRILEWIKRATFRINRGSSRGQADGCETRGERMSVRLGCDPLDALAPLLRVSPELQAICRFGRQWASAHAIPEPGGWAAFHLVIAGRCVLDIDTSPAIPLVAGDIVLLPHGETHVVRGVTTPPDSMGIPGLHVADAFGIELRTNASAPDVELVCGRLKFYQLPGNLARAVLPALIVLHTADNPTVIALRELLLAIKRELESLGPGSRAICDDLASALMVMALREHFRGAAATQALPRLLSEPQTARAVVAMLDDPARDWTLQAIATAANSSRATLARDFHRLAAMTPIGFLTDLRLTLARHHLAASSRPLAEIAAAAGYQSASAFGRAFQRRFGQAPGSIRHTRTE